MTRLSEAILNNSRGVVLTLHDPQTVSVLRRYVDFFVLDCAARKASIETIEKLLAAAGETPFLVRSETTNTAALQTYLNTGIDGLILCDVHFATEAEKALAACLYPPEGTRSYRAAAATRYGIANDVSLPALNDQLTLVIEVAHPQTVAQLEEIAEVTGVDGFLVNPERLSVAMEKGLEGATTADVKQALYRVQSVANAFECPFGWEGEAVDDIVPNFILAASDVQMLAASAKAFFASESGEAGVEEASGHLRAVR